MGMFSRLNKFRKDWLFVFGVERRRELAVVRHERDAEVSVRVRAFSDSVVSLIHARAHKAYHGYELKFYVPRDTLETAAGEQAAIAAMVVPLAQLITQRHRREIDIERIAAIKSSKHNETRKLATAKA